MKTLSLCLLITSFLLGTLAPVAVAQAAECPAPTGDPPPPIAYSADEDYARGVAATFVPQILAYLNTTGSTDGLQEALDAVRDDANVAQVSGTQVFAADLTRDDLAEVVVNLNVDFGGGAEGAILAFTCADGAYEHLGSLETWGMSDDPAYLPQIIAIADMDGDSAPDIVHSYVSVVGRGFIRVVEIHEWDGYRFDILAGPWQVWAGNGEVRATEDGALELVLTSPEIYRPEYDADGQLDWRQTEAVWRWLGGLFIPTCHRVISAPDFRFEAVENGDDNLFCGFYNADYYGEAMAYYQRVIEDETLFAWPLDCGTPYTCAKDYPDDYPTDPAERPRLTAYARFRLIQAHLLLADEDAAQAQFAMLRKEFPAGAPGYEYAATAIAFWEAYQATGDLGAACEVTLAYADEHSEELFVIPDIYRRETEGISHGYFDRFLDSPWRFCPFYEGWVWGGTAE